MRYLTRLVLFTMLLVSCINDAEYYNDSHDLVFSELPKVWDEGIPLGNGMLGALVWQKDSKLRISLDRVDLWDLRPMKNLDFNKFTYDWVYKQWKNDTYSQVQEQLDVPYDQRVAPAKILAAALEFDISEFGPVSEVRLSVSKALCTVKWENGQLFEIFVNGDEESGWYRFSNCKAEPVPELIPPEYTKEGAKVEKNVIFKADLAHLGYKKGIINKKNREIEYIQEGWGGYKYSVALQWDTYKARTTHDLGLIRWSLGAAAEMATELGLTDEAEYYTNSLHQWPSLAYDSSGLIFAPSHPYDNSHRHFSHLLGWHPLGLLDYSNPDDAEIIDNTLATLEKTGSDYWVGYSFSWLGNLYARAGKGEKAAEAIRTFSQAFCLPNSFHANGDQTKSGFSKYTYRPSTLEGNFAFASGLQDMLIQSHSGIIKVFPAIPSDWKEASFKQLRTYGAFLVSADLEKGLPVRIKI